MKEETKLKVKFDTKEDCDSFMDNPEVLLIPQGLNDLICQWAEDDEWGVYETECGETFEIIVGTPNDNRMIYCCFCGKEICEAEIKKAGE